MHAIVCAYRREAGSSNNFEALRYHKQLGSKDNQDCEDPAEYCYGTVESVVRFIMCIRCSHTLLPNLYPRPFPPFR